MMAGKVHELVVVRGGRQGVAAQFLEQSGKVVECRRRLEERTWIVLTITVWQN